MGGLAHYLEDEGLATTQISLIREHTKTINPPRALWVPFELGRPLGAPNDAEFQNRVLRAALDLLTEQAGPVLRDFPDDAPTSNDSPQVVACPVNFNPQPQVVNDLDRLVNGFDNEFNQMRTWYDLARENSGRTTAGTAALEPEAAANFLTSFIQDKPVDMPLPEITLGTALKLAAEDIKAYYLEAVASQPGQPSDAATLAAWFWGETLAAQVVNRVREICLASDDEKLRVTGFLVVPRNQIARFEA